MGERETLFEFRSFLTDVRMRMADEVTRYVCNRVGRDPRDFDDAPDPADVHEDVREALSSFFQEIQDRVFGPECSSEVRVGSFVYAKCDLLEGHDGPHHPCAGTPWSGE